jgi:hypothetical protein
MKGAACAKRIKSERNAFFLLGLSFLAVVWWYATWGLVEEYMEWIEEKYKISKTNLYLSVAFLIVLIVFLFPELLDKI